MRLSVNLNKVALLRNQRDLDMPSITVAARTILQAGACGITVHPRPDGRHTLASDVRALRKVVTEFCVELNVEGNPYPEFLALIAEVAPHQVTLVPDDPAARTSDHGWDAAATHREQLSQAIAIVRDCCNARVALFMDHDAPMSSAAEVGADAIELYTEPYAKAALAGQSADLLSVYAEAARAAAAAGLQVHAGHDLNLDNLGAFLAAVPEIAEVSIGHAFTAEALWLGLAETTTRYLGVIADHHPDHHDR